MQLEYGPKGERHDREAPSRQGTRHLQGGGAAVDDDGLAVVEEFGTSGADPGLLFGMAEGPHGVGGLFRGAPGTGGASVHTAEDAVAFEGFEVPAHRHLRAAEVNGQGRYLDLLVLPQSLHDLAAAPHPIHRPNLTESLCVYT